MFRIANKWEHDFRTITIGFNCFYNNFTWVIRCILNYSYKYVYNDRSIEGYYQPVLEQGKADPLTGWYLWMFAANSFLFVTKAIISDPEIISPWSSFTVGLRIYPGRLFQIDNLATKFGFPKLFIDHLNSGTHSYVSNIRRIVVFRPGVNNNIVPVETSARRHVRKSVSIQHFVLCVVVPLLCWSVSIVEPVLLTKYFAFRHEFLQHWIPTGKPPPCQPQYIFALKVGVKTKQLNSSLDNEIFQIGNVFFDRRTRRDGRTIPCPLEKVSKFETRQPIFPKRNFLAVLRHALPWELPRGRFEVLQSALSAQTPSGVVHTLRI